MSNISADKKVLDTLSVAEYLAARDVALWGALAFISGAGCGLWQYSSPVGFVLLAILLGIVTAGAFFFRRALLFCCILGFFLLGIARSAGAPLALPWVTVVTPTLEQVRDYFASGIERALIEPYAAYGKGILLGGREDIPYDLTQAFRHTGTSHLTALSGYNVSVIIEYFGMLSRGVFVPLVGIAAFVIATGAASSLVRAAFMGVLVLVVRRTGFEYAAGRALLYAVAAMLFWSPHILFEDVGFQLSVAATAGIVFLVPRFNSWFSFVPLSLSIREALSTTLAAQIATLPLILFYFGLPSWVSLPANVLVGIAMPLSMAAVFIAGVGGLLSNMLAPVLGLGAHLILRYQLFVIMWFANLY